MQSLNRKIRKNKFLVLIPLISFLSLTALPFENITKSEAAQFGMSAEFLIQTGISFYDNGRFADAMSEFKKALIIDPNSRVAREFIKQIQKELISIEEKKETIKEAAAPLILETKPEKPGLIPVSKEPGLAVGGVKIKKKKPQALSLEKEEKLLPKKALKKEPLKIAKKLSAEKAATQETKPPAAKTTIMLDEETKATQPNTLIEMERDGSVLIQGDNIKRFLNTTESKIKITRQDQNTLLVTAIGVGRGIFHIWDNSGRWTFDFEGKHKKFVGAFGETYEMGELPVGLADPFKLSYSFDWGSFLTGRRLGDIQRQSLSFDQSLGLRGETPYGQFDSSVLINRLNRQYQLNNLTMGLTDAHYGDLEHVNLRFFDFSPTFSAYKFPSAQLRGINVSAPVSGGKLNYNVFSGGLPVGNYTQLQPGLGRTKDAHLEGAGVQYKLSDNTKYKIYYAHTRGSELNTPVLTNSAFGLGAFYKIGKLNLNSEVANDAAGHTSYTSDARLTLPKVGVSLGVTDDDRDFVSPFGGESSGGSISARFGLDLSPTKDFSISNNFTASRDRRLFNPDDPKRPNYALDSNATWQLDPVTSVNMGYTRDDTKGTISPGLTQTKRLGIRRDLFFIKRIHSYLNYVNSTNKYFNSSSSNYDRNTFSGGLGFNVIGDLFFNIGESINFIEDRFTKENAHPHVMDSSLSYYSRILDSPFYGRFRVSYRDEEKADSPLSFLSGQDRLEFSSELDYRPNPFIDGYLSFRVANIWAETEAAAKHLDAEVRYGLRINWDTGFRWDTEGNVEGFVFYDLDGNSSRDKDETGVKDVTIKTNTNKSDSTSERGYYRIKNIVGKKTRISIDLNTIPRGYILTTPASYDLDLKQGATKRADFGITTRAEIVGVVFLDSNGNNKFDREEEGLVDVVMILDGTQKVKTEQNGQYLFRKLSPGQHLIEIDLKTLPTKYIPKVPLKKKVTVEQGVTFFYNVPLRAAVQFPVSESKK